MTKLNYLIAAFLLVPLTARAEVNVRADEKVDVSADADIKVPVHKVEQEVRKTDADVKQDVHQIKVSAAARASADESAGKATATKAQIEVQARTNRVKTHIDDLIAKEAMKMKDMKLDERASLSSSARTQGKASSASGVSLGGESASSASASAGVGSTANLSASLGQNLGTTLSAQPNLPLLGHK